VSGAEGKDGGSIMPEVFCSVDECEHNKDWRCEETTIYITKKSIRPIAYCKLFVEKKKP
jgi:hypothetical protein